MPSTADSALAARRAREVKRDPGLLYTDQLRLRDLLSISPRGLPFDLPVTRLTLSLERGDVLVLEEDSGWRIPKDSFKFDDGLRTGVVISLFSSADLVVSFAVHFRNLPLHSPAFFPLAARSPTGCILVLSFKRGIELVASPPEPKSAPGPTAPSTATSAQPSVPPSPATAGAGLTRSMSEVQLSPPISPASSVSVGPWYKGHKRNASAALPEAPGDQAPKRRLPSLFRSIVLGSERTSYSVLSLCRLRRLQLALGQTQMARERLHRELEATLNTLTPVRQLSTKRDRAQFKVDMLREELARFRLRVDHLLAKEVDREEDLQERGIRLMSCLHEFKLENSAHKRFSCQASSPGGAPSHRAHLTPQQQQRLFLLGLGSPSRPPGFPSPCSRITCPGFSRSPAAPTNPAGSLHTDSETMRDQLMVIQTTLNLRRITLIQELLAYFPIAKDDLLRDEQKKKKEEDKNKSEHKEDDKRKKKEKKTEEETTDQYTICGYVLPDAETPLTVSEVEVNVALGNLCHLLILISAIVGLPLRFSIRFVGSRSTIVQPFSPLPYPVPEPVPITDPVEFPLYNKKQFADLFEYAMFLLNLNIRELRLSFGLQTADPRRSLFNIVDLLSKRMAVKWNRFSTDSDGLVYLRNLSDFVLVTKITNEELASCPSLMDEVIYVGCKGTALAKWREVEERRRKRKHHLFCSHSSLSVACNGGDDSCALDLACRLHEDGRLPFREAEGHPCSSTGTKQRVPLILIESRDDVSEYSGSPLNPCVVGCSHLEISDGSDEIGPISPSYEARDLLEAADQEAADVHGGSHFGADDCGSGHFGSDECGGGHFESDEYGGDHFGVVEVREVRGDAASEGQAGATMVNGVVVPQEENDEQSVSIEEAEDVVAGLVLEEDVGRRLEALSSSVGTFKTKCASSSPTD